MRQAFYTTARFGIFLNLTDYKKRTLNVENLPFFQKMQCSLLAGGLGSIVGTPADLILVRMQADTTLPEEKRRGYTSFFNAARRIPAEEGVLSLWKGGFPTVVRAMSLNLGMFTTYEEAKERFGAAMPNNQGLAWFLASWCAGATAAIMSLPFDNAKTKLQKQTAGADGKLPYKNIFDALQKTARDGGVPGLWVGLPTYIVRIAPHVMITLIISEKLKAALIKK
jgi:solute carrier family 25 oxoglutarate transporter 11